MMVPLLAAGSVLLLVALLAAAAFLARRHALHPELARKAVHVGLGLYSLTFPFLFQTPGPVLAICGVAVALLMGLRFSRGSGRGLGAGLHGVARESYGELLFGASVALLFVLGHRTPVTYVLPLAILALSDAAAALVGVRYGRATFRIEDGHKSVEGAVIFFLTAWIIGMSLLLLLSDAPRLNVVVLGGVIAAYGTLVESVSWRGWDNFFLPVSIHLVLLHHLDSPPWMLLTGAAAGVAWLVGGQRLALARHVGMDRHTAVFTAALLATIGLASNAWNVVLPSLAFGCHLLAEARSPSPRPNPHLKLGLVIVMLGITWYVVSDVTNLFTVTAFNASFGALSVATLAAAGRPVLALAAVPLFWAVIEARSLFPGAPPTDGLVAQATLMLLLAGAVGAASLARLRWRPVACERMGLLALAAGVAMFAFPQ